MSRADRTVIRSIGGWIFLATAILGRADEWPQFRGASGTGVSENAGIPLEWSKTKNLAWKTAIPGRGWSQPVAIGSTVYLTAAVSDKPQEPPDYESGTSDPYTLEGAKAIAPAIMLDWKLIALDLQNGAMKWERSIASGKPKYPVHPSNTYASETPAADAQGVYAWFGAAGMAVAFDHSGQRLWEKNLGVFRQQNNVGTASSLRLYHRLLYLQCFNEEEAVLICLNAKDGKEEWRLARPSAGTAWNTPFLWRNTRRAELVISGPKLLTGLDPLTGKEYWRASAREMPVIPSITGDAQRLYFGYRDPVKGGPLFALGDGAGGEQSLDQGDKAFLMEAWKAPDAAPGIPSPLAVSGCVYVLNGNVVICLDAATGKENYKRRLPGFRTVVASPIACGDRVLILDEAGHALVLQAGAKFQILGQARLDDRFWASPAVVNGALLLRGLECVYCIRSLPAQE